VYKRASGKFLYSRSPTSPFLRADRAGPSNTLAAGAQLTTGSSSTGERIVCLRVSHAGSPPGSSAPSLLSSMDSWWSIGTWLRTKRRGPSPRAAGRCSVIGFRTSKPQRCSWHLPGSHRVRAAATVGSIFAPRPQIIRPVCLCPLPTAPETEPGLSQDWASQNSGSLSAMAESVDDGTAVLNFQW